MTLKPALLNLLCNAYISKLTIKYSLIMYNLYLKKKKVNFHKFSDKKKTVVVLQRILWNLIIFSTILTRVNLFYFRKKKERKGDKYPTAGARWDGWASFHIPTGTNTSLLSSLPRQCFPHPPSPAEIQHIQALSISSMDAKLFKDKRFWLASFLVAWAAALQVQLFFFFFF